MGHQGAVGPGPELRESLIPPMHTRFTVWEHCACLILSGCSEAQRVGRNPSAGTREARPSGWDAHCLGGGTEPPPPTSPLLFVTSRTGYDLPRGVALPGVAHPKPGEVVRGQEGAWPLGLPKAASGFQHSPGLS